MKIVLALLFVMSSAMAATHTRVISKITDVYQIKSGQAQLLESEYQVGTFNDLDGLATDIQTFTENQKDKKTDSNKKLQKVLTLSGIEGEFTSKNISSEVCNTEANRKYCSTSIELTF